MKAWTREELAALSVHDRAALYSNACKLAHTPAGADLKKRVEEAGLPFSEPGCLSSDDPIYRAMEELIATKNAKDAAVAAVQAGLPAMAAIDPLLQAMLGSDYGPHNMGTQTAGSLVAEIMRTLGYEKTGEAPLPAGCVAKTAATWAPRVR